MATNALMNTRQALGLYFQNNPHKMMLYRGSRQIASSLSQAAGYKITQGQVNSLFKKMQSYNDLGGNNWVPDLFRKAGVIRLELISDKATCYENSAYKEILNGNEQEHIMLEYVTCQESSGQEKKKRVWLKNREHTKAFLVQNNLLAQGVEFESLRSMLQTNDAYKEGRAVVIEDEKTMSKFCSKDGTSRVLRMSFPAREIEKRPNAETDILVVACLDAIKDDSLRADLLRKFEEPRGLASLFDGKNEEQMEATKAAIDTVSQEKNLIKKISENDNYIILKIRSWSRFESEFYKRIFPDSKTRLKINTIRDNLMKKDPCGQHGGIVKYMFTRSKVDKSVQAGQKGPSFKAVAFKVHLGSCIDRGTDQERLFLQNVIKKQLWEVSFESTIMIREVVSTEEVLFTTHESAARDAKTA